MDVSLFIASRLRFKGKIATLSVAISSFVMIIAIAVSSGFRHEIRGGLSSVSGDVQLSSPYKNIYDGSAYIESDPAYLPYVVQTDGVSDVVPVVYRAGIVKNGETIHGVLFKGIDSDASDSVSLGVSIPERLSQITGLMPGDKMLSYFVGETLKLRNFNVVSVYDSMIETDDNLIVYASLSDMQRLNGWDAGKVSAIEIHLDQSHKDEQSIEDVASEVGFAAASYASEDEEPVLATSSVSMYPQLFDWLNLIDFNVVVILVLMMIVAGFNMISGLLIMLFENISTIGLLKALGMTDRAIARSFLASSAVLVAKGLFIGNFLAFVIYMIQKTTHILKLDPENYFVSFVPMNLDFAAVFAADLVAFAAIMLFLLIPCLFIAKVDPAHTVRVK